MNAQEFLWLILAISSVIGCAIGYKTNSVHLGILGVLMSFGVCIGLSITYAKLIY